MYQSNHFTFSAIWMSNHSASTSGMGNDLYRFLEVAKALTGRRLTFEELTAKGSTIKTAAKFVKKRGSAFKTLTKSLLSDVVESSLSCQSYV